MTRPREPLVSPPRRPLTRLATWGNIRIPHTRSIVRWKTQEPNALRTGPEGQRDARQGQLSAAIASLSGGIVSRAGIHDWLTSLDKVYYNQGLQHHIPGVLTEPYALTTQAALVSADFSTYRAANRRVHGFNTNVGQSLMRFGVAIGPRIFVTTSDTDHSLKVVYTGTNNIMSAGEVVMNNIRYMAFGTDGTTQDTFGVVSINADPVVRTELITHVGGDVCNGIVNLERAGMNYNVFYGRFTNDGLFYAAHSASIPIGSASLLRVIWTKSKAEQVQAVDGSPTSTGATAETVSYDITDGGVVWGTDVDTPSPLTQTYGYAWAYGADFSAVPDHAIIKGLTIAITYTETGAGNSSLTINGARLFVGGSVAGIGFGVETITATTTFTYGSTTNALGTNLKGSQLGALAVRISGATVTWTGGTGSDWTVTSVTVNVTYVVPGGVNGISTPGTAIDLPVGGYCIGSSPIKPERVGYVLPISDELTTINQPRRLAFADFAYDAPGNQVTDQNDVPRITAEITYPNTGLSHVEHACWFAGGVAICGDNSSGIATSAKHIRSDSQVVDLRFPGSYNGKACGIVNIYGQGNLLVCEVAFEDASDTQWWFYFDGRWYASTLIQSKSNAIASLPLAWGSFEVGLKQRRIYRFFPVSTTALAAARTFLPGDLLNDPRLTNTGETKYAGALYAQLPELDLFGAIEANKTINAIDYLERFCSTAAAGQKYGTIQVDIDTGGDTAINTAEVTTGGQSTALWAYNVPSSGVAAKTAIIRITLDNTSVNTAPHTPNGLPILITGTIAWPNLVTATLYIDDHTLGAEDVITLLNRLQTKQNTKATQPLKLGKLSVPATLVIPQLILEASGLDVPARLVAVNQTGQLGPPYLLFEAKRGTA